jgi:hypothetical protein
MQATSVSERKLWRHPPTPFSWLSFYETHSLSAFLLVIEISIDMTGLISPGNSGYGLVGTGFPNGKLPPETGLTPIAYIRFL